MRNNLHSPPSSPFLKKGAEYAGAQTHGASLLSILTPGPIRPPSTLTSTPPLPQQTCRRVPSLSESRGITNTAREWPWLAALGNMVGQHRSRQGGGGTLITRRPRAQALGTARARPGHSHDGEGSERLTLTAEIHLDASAGLPHQGSPRRSIQPHQDPRG
ncbi:hypothetical protein GWK47_027738 [Chionoecetes opilio]|uniref:Uncharacterized protein n=1 Tax=Chionoecetes opilio TaxID=41210 RepID=A0A8J8WD72_CHIOP|nr:hypothetical protein GWK47_027738 [Chionoecetes opilio]